MPPRSDVVGVTIVSDGQCIWSDPCVRKLRKNMHQCNDDLKEIVLTNNLGMAV